jgi:hypothetical protein
MIWIFTLAMVVKSMTNVYYTMYHFLLLQDFDKISNFISSNFSTELEEVELSVKGWNWGSTHFTGQSYG